MKDYYAPIILLFAFTGVIFLYDYYIKIKNERILRAEIRKNFGKIHSKKFKGKIDGIHKRLGGNLSNSSWFKLRQNNWEYEPQYDKTGAWIFLL